MCFKTVLNDINHKKLDDNRFLDEFTKSFYFLKFEKTAALKNLNSEYIAASESYAQLVGYNIQELIYKTDKDLKCTMAYLANNYNKQDYLIRVMGKSISTIEIHNYANGRGMYLFHKIPVINPATNNIVGIYIEVQPFKPYSIYNVFKDSFIEVNDSEASERKNLGQKQEEVLFCLLAGIRESKKIVDFIYRIKGSCYSIYTVNNAIKALCSKFKANCKDTLIHTALSINSHICPPNSLLEFGSYSINEFLSN